MTGGVQAQHSGYSFVSNLAFTGAQVLGKIARVSGAVYDRLPQPAGSYLFKGLICITSAGLVAVPIVGVLASIKITYLAIAALGLVALEFILIATLYRGHMSEFNAWFIESVASENPIQMSFLLSAGALGSRDEDRRTPLVAVARSGRTESVRQLIALGADVNEACRLHGNTPLMYAAARGHTETVQALLMAGAHIDIRNRYGTTALLFAAENGHAATVRELVRLIDVNEACRLHGNTPLMYAAAGGHTETVQALIAAGAHVRIRNRVVHTVLGFVSHTALDLAERGRHAATRNALLAAEQRAEMDFRNAAQRGDTARVRELVAAGESINVWDGQDHMSVLALAARGGRRETVQALLELGADADAHARNGMTALMQAAKAGDTETVQALITLRPDVDARDRQGMTALMWAAYSGYTPIVRALVHAGARVDAMALIYAAREGHTETVRALVDLGTDVDTQDDDGTALIHAARGGHTETVQALIDAGAAVNAQDRWGRRSALMFAARGGHTAAVEALISAGADVNLVGSTALEMAYQYVDAARRLEILRALFRAPHIDRNFVDALGRTLLSRAVLDGRPAEEVVFLAQQRIDPSIADRDGLTAPDHALRGGALELIRVLARNFVRLPLGIRGQQISVATYVRERGWELTDLQIQAAARAYRLGLEDARAETSQFFADTDLAEEPTSILDLIRQYAQ